MKPVSRAKARLRDGAVHRLYVLVHSVGLQLCCNCSAARKTSHSHLVFGCSPTQKRAKQRLLSIVVEQHWIQAYFPVGSRIGRIGGAGQAHRAVLGAAIEPLRSLDLSQALQRNNIRMVLVQRHYTPTGAGVWTVGVRGKADTAILGAAIKK